MSLTVKHEPYRAWGTTHHRGRDNIDLQVRGVLNWLAVLNGESLADCKLFPCRSGDVVMRAWICRAMRSVPGILLGSSIANYV